MKILGNRVLVSQVEKEVKEGFTTVDVQDDFVYKGRVAQVGVQIGVPISSYTATTHTLEGGEFMEIKEGDIIIFAKYSPDTHEIEHEGKKYKSVLISDILAVL